MLRGPGEERRIMFRLEKWYLDLTTERGAVAILYSAHLDWGPLHTDYSSVLRSDDGGPPRERTTIRHGAPPELGDRTLTWGNPRLGVHGTWDRCDAAIHQTLCTSAGRSIDWTCHMPRAFARLHCGDDLLEGFGYAECLVLTIPPGDLPFHELRWGRHLSPEHSLVWIDWAHGAERHWMWLDGKERRAALAVRDSHDVVDRNLLWFLHEHKQVSRSALVRDGRALDEGWTIDEVVTFH